MARSTGGINFPNNFEVKKAAPLDARLWCSTLNDMYALRFTHKGMVVSVTDETDNTLNGLYVMQNQIAPDVDSQLSDWEIVGTGDNSSGSFSTTFSGAHSITEDRNSTASLGSVTVDSGLSYIGGELITITAGHDLGYMQYAQVTSYSGTTLEFNHIESTTNYSESTDWNINLTGKIGTDGTSVKYATIFDAPHGTDESRGPNESLGSLTIETGLSYIGGEYITVSPVVSPESIQVARVTSYDASTGVITFEHISHTGSQAYSDSGDWNLNLSGAPSVGGNNTSSTLQDVLDNNSGAITANSAEDLSISSKEMKLTGNSNNGINNNSASIEISKDGVGDITISGSNMGTPSKGDVLVSKDSDGSLEWRKLNRNYFQTLTEIDNSYTYDLDIGLNAFIYHDNASPIYIDIINLENGSSGNIIIERSNLDAAINLGSIDGRLITSSSVNHKFLGGVEFTGALETCIVSYICRIDINNIITMYWTIGNSYT